MAQSRKPVTERAQGLGAVAAAVFGVLVVAGLPASAQNRVIVIEEEELTVELEKPEAFYILSPSNLTYRSVDAEASFLDELYETVEKEPF